MNIILSRNLADSPTPRNIVLEANPAPDEQQSVMSDVFWRWENEPNMQPQYLGSVTGGHTLSVPFELKNRPIRLFAVARNAEGQSRELSNMADVPQYVYQPPTAPILVSLIFDGVEDEVQGSVANAGGSGSIRVLRRRTSEPAFAEIDVLGVSETAFIDVPSIDGTYEYKLIQDGLPGVESNVRSVVVDVGTPGSGSPPSGLSGTYNPSSNQVELAWSYNGGAGDLIVERRIGSAAYEIIATLGTSATSHTMPEFGGRDPKLLTFRVSNSGTDGFSNEEEVFVPGLELH